MPNSPSSQDLELAKFFTDVEPLRDWFDKAIVADKLPKRLLVIWGVGGIGKSSLLRMFRLNCKMARVPVGLASGDEAKSAVDVLTRWAEDLSVDGANLTTFSKTLEHYRAIQAKVEDQAKATNKKLGDVAGKAAGKVAEAGAAAAVGAVVGSVIPGIGTIAGALGGMGAEALVDWLRSFLTKPDIDLYTDPSKKLTDDFLADVNQFASKQRIVLMLDTYEQMTALDDWTRTLAQQLNENILLVIAGRAMVNWGRQWSSWLMHAQVEELKPMPRRVMHELIRKYYATMRGGEPNPKQVNAIIEFSGGLPMVVNTAVQLWVKYGVEDFGAVKGEVVREVVARLREGVPAELYPLLETAAAMRYFNKDILRAVSGMGDIGAGYDELRRFPFVRSRAEGYALHDRVRDMIEENVRTDDPAKYRAVHERAAAYFEMRIADTSSEEAERLGLERLYHRVCADEASGIKLFQETAEILARQRLVNRLRTLVGDVHTYASVDERNKQWVSFYEAEIAYIDIRFDEAIKILEIIQRNKRLDRKLRGYALSSLAVIYKRSQFLFQSQGFERAIQYANESSNLLTGNDTRAIQNLVSIGEAHIRQGHVEEASDYFQRALRTFEEKGDIYGVANLYVVLLGMSARTGDWKQMYHARKMGSEIFPEGFENSAAYIELVGHWTVAWSWAGRYAEPEKNLRKALELRQRVGEVDLGGWLHDLGYVLGMQGRFKESNICFEQAVEGHNQILNRDDPTDFGFWAHILARQGDLELAENYARRSWQLKENLNDFPGFPELAVWQGEICELQGKMDWAEEIYRRGLKFRWTMRFYFECGSLTGLVRGKHAQRDYAAIPPLLAEAEQLAQQYEYNDHLASLRLTQGHIAWDGHIPEWGEGFDAAFKFYKLALVHALRFNRFLLDEVLSGRPQGTPLRPIIPECLKRGEEGRKMLLGLHDWWHTGKNDVGTPRPDTISPIPENIALLEAEKIAREREPGDGSAQTSVVKQIENALNRA